MLIKGDIIASLDSYSEYNPKFTFYGLCKEKIGNHNNFECIPHLLLNVQWSYSIVNN